MLRNCVTILLGKYVYGHVLYVTISYYNRCQTAENITVYCRIERAQRVQCRKITRDSRELKKKKRDKHIYTENKRDCGASQKRAGPGRLFLSDKKKKNKRYRMLAYIDIAKTHTRPCDN